MSKFSVNVLDPVIVDVPEGHSISDVIDKAKLALLEKLMQDDADFRLEKA